MSTRSSRLRSRESPKEEAAPGNIGPSCQPAWVASLGGRGDQVIEPVMRTHLETMEPMITSLAELNWQVSRTLVEAIARALRASEDPLRAAFLTRSLNALSRLSGHLKTKAIGEAVCGLSDYEVLLRALEEPDALTSLEGDDPFAAARLRDLELREGLIKAEGGTLSADQVAKRLGITRQAVDKRRRMGRLIAVPIGQHRYAYPVWQFDPSGILPGLEDVLAELSLPDPWTRLAFFLGENTYLSGARPLDELRKGNVDAVRRAAWAMGEQGAA